MVAKRPAGQGQVPNAEQPGPGAGAPAHPTSPGSSRGSRHADRPPTQQARARASPARRRAEPRARPGCGGRGNAAGRPQRPARHDRGRGRSRRRDALPGATPTARPCSTLSSTAPTACSTKSSTTSTAKRYSSRARGRQRVPVALSRDRRPADPAVARRTAARQRPKAVQARQEINRRLDRFIEHGAPPTAASVRRPTRPTSSSSARSSPSRCHTAPTGH